MYWGKIVGGALGLISGRWYFVLLGIIVGDQFDRGFARMAAAGSVAAPDSDFIDVLFAVMGHVAKADGLVTEAEIRAARAAMHTLRLDGAATERAIAAFTRGKSPDYPLADALGRFVERHRGESERSMFLKLQLTAAIDAGPLGRPARDRLWQVSRQLGFSRVEFAQLEAVLRAQRGFKQSSAGRTDAARLGRAYQTLGIAESASDGEVKHAYRRLMNKIHPDKLSASDPTEAELAAAGRRSSEARAAYELICRRRGLR